MMLRFDTYQMTDDWKMKTRTLNGKHGFVVPDRFELYRHDDLLRIVKTAHKIERSQFGWMVLFVRDGQNKYVFLRGNDEKKYETLSAKQSIFDWIDFLYDENSTLF